MLTLHEKGQEEFHGYVGSLTGPFLRFHTDLHCFSGRGPRHRIQVHERVKKRRELLRAGHANDFQLLGHDRAHSGGVLLHEPAATGDRIFELR